jgi:hypothetical protein
MKRPPLSSFSAKARPFMSFAVSARRKPGEIHHPDL